MPGAEGGVMMRACAPAGPSWHLRDVRRGQRGNQPHPLIEAGLLLLGPTRPTSGCRIGEVGGRRHGAFTAEAMPRAFACSGRIR